MTTTDEVTIEVPTVALRQALTAVHPHAAKHKTGEQSAAHRVRLMFGATELWVVATNGHTSALAVCNILADSRKERFAPDDGPFALDITPRHAKNLLQQFKSSSGSGADMEEALQLLATPDRLRVTDVGGLWAGEDQGVPTLPLGTDYPDVAKLLGLALFERGSDPMAKPLVSGSGLLALFRQASETYGAPLDFRATGPKESRGYLVFCGQSFVGSIESRHADDEFHRRSDAVYRAHLARFGMGGAIDPVAEAAAALGSDGDDLDFDDDVDTDRRLTSV